MLPNYQVLDSFYFAKNEKLSFQLKPETLLIDCSTIGPTQFLKVYDKLKKKGNELIDAPVSGGVKGAENATLTFMVGSSNAGTFNVE